MRQWKTGLLGLLWVTAALAAEPDIVPGKVIDGIPTGDDPGHTYAVYLPSQYDANKPWPLLFLFDPAARGSNPVTQFAAAAETHGFILAGSNRTRNYVGWELNAAAVRDLWKDVSTRFNVNPKLIYAGGFSGGARLTTRLATATQNLAGVILCGAGFHTSELDQIAINYPVAVTIGNTDMNWLEVVSLEASLAEKNITYHVARFEGGHQWPPRETCHDILGWLRLTAVQRGLLPNTDVADYLAWRKKQADDAYAADDVVRGVALDRALLRHFAGMADLTVIETRLAQHREDPRVIEDRDAKRAAEQFESLYRRDMLSRMARGEAQPPVGPVALDQALSWWRNLAKRLKSKQESATEPREKEAIQRLYNMAGSVIYEKSVYDLREEKWDAVIYLTEITRLLLPNMPYPHFYQAIAFAHKDQHDRAFDELGIFITKSGQPASSFASDQRLAPLFDDPRWQELVQ